MQILLCTNLEPKTATITHLFRKTIRIVIKNNVSMFSLREDLKAVPTSPLESSPHW